MTRTLCFAIWLAFALISCSAPRYAMELPCARVEWEPPERIEGGGELPVIRVRERGCGEITFEVRAFRDANRDGQADDAESITTARIGPVDREGELTRVRLLAPVPLRWALWLQTPEGDALVDLGWIR
jgi:hypothetical protein